MDYYDVLGVATDASDKDIKTAYRKLASQHHPDKGGDEAEFKRIQEAYETLGDAGKRQEYNMFGSQGRQGFQGGFQRRGPNDFHFRAEDIFADMFGAGRTRQQAQRAPDARVDVSITLAEAFNGAEKILTLGWGYEEITIQPGTFPGQQQVMPGAGMPGPNGERGNLIIRFRVVTPENVGIDPRTGDIVTRTEVDLLTAMTGGNVEVDFGTGKKYNCKVQPGSSSGTRLRLRGQGFSRPGHTSDVFVELAVKIPAITDPDAVEQLNKIIGGNNNE